MMTRDYASLTPIEPDVFQFGESEYQTLPKKDYISPIAKDAILTGFESHMAFCFPETDDLDLVNFHKEHTHNNFHVTNLDTCVRVVYIIPGKGLSNRFKQQQEHEIWEGVNGLNASGEMQMGLIFLFRHLHESLNDYLYCDNFLNISLNKQLSSDEIVHVLNALSPIKDNLTNWQNFVIHCYELLKAKGGEKYANTLLKVIV